MIKITYTRRLDGYLHEFLAVGHAEQAEYGKDIVCAAVTAVFTGLLKSMAELSMVYMPDAITREGYLYLRLPQLEFENRDNRLILGNLAEALIISCKDIASRYSSAYIYMEEKRHLGG